MLPAQGAEPESATAALWTPRLQGVERVRAALPVAVVVPTLAAPPLVAPAEQPQAARPPAAPARVAAAARVAVPAWTEVSSSPARRTCRPRAAPARASPFSVRGAPSRASNAVPPAIAARASGPCKRAPPTARRPRRRLATRMRLPCPARIRPSCASTHRTRSAHASPAIAIRPARLGPPPGRATANPSARWSWPATVRPGPCPMRPRARRTYPT